MKGSEVETATKAVQALRQALRACQSTTADTRKSVEKEQLRAVKKAIGQLERASLPVIDGSLTERERLATSIREDAGGPLAGVYHELLDVMDQLGRMCNRRPHRDLLRKFRDRGEETSATEILKDSMVRALREMGGEGWQRDVFLRIERELGEKFTEADRDCGRGSFTRWQQRVRREVKAMTADGQLSRGRGGAWVLSK